MTIRSALIFAAGRGERMRPLTDATPKPLLDIGSKRLIEHHLEKLAAAGVERVVINTSHLAEQFPAALGDGNCSAKCDVLMTTRSTPAAASFSR